MSKEEIITVPHFEGYKCIGYRIPKIDQYYLLQGELVIVSIPFSSERIIYEKITPKRYIFEEIGEFRVPQDGEWFLYDDDSIYKSDGLWKNNHRIIKQIHE